MNLGETALLLDVLSSSVSPVAPFLQQSCGSGAMVKKYDYDFVINKDTS